MKAHDASLGYPADGPPLVPLKGPIVAETPGILEVYQTHMLFQNSAAGSALISSARGFSVGGGSTTHLSAPKVNGANDSYEFVSTLGPMSPETEHEVAIGLLFGRSVVELVLRGGADVTADMVAQYVTEAAQLFERLCK